MTNAEKARTLRRVGERLEILAHRYEHGPAIDTDEQLAELVAELAHVADEARDDADDPLIDR